MLTARDVAQPEDRRQNGLHLRGLLRLLQGQEPYRRVLARTPEPGQTSPLGVPFGARAFVAAALALHLNRPLLLLTAQSRRARELADVLATWLGTPDRVHLFADPEPMPYERMVWSRDTRRQRLAALAALARWRKGHPAPVVVASVRALMWKTLPAREMHLSVRTLHVGDAITMHRLSDLLLSLGYTPVSVVDTPGTFSHRGGILDLFPTGARHPVRIDFFGDEIDSLRYFDPETQRTLTDRPRPRAVVLTPASEALLRYAPRAAQRLQDLDLSTCHTALTTTIQEEIRKLEQGTNFQHLEFYLPYFYSRPATLLEHVPTGGIVLVEDEEELRSTWQHLDEQAEQVRRDALATREIPANLRAPHFTWEQVVPFLQAQPIWVLGQGALFGPPKEETPLRDLFEAAPYFGGKVRRLLARVLDAYRSGDHIILLSRQARRLAELLTSAGYPIAPQADLESMPQQPGITLVQGVLPGGFLLHLHPDPSESDTQPGRVWFLTDMELFGFRKAARRLVQARPTSPDPFFTDVKRGDFVVHIDHGIGIFRGLVHLDIDGETREYLQVDYAQGDKLYVPVHQADRLARYVGPRGTPPVLNRLGTADWDLVKRRAKRAIADIAEELLELYALRETVRGHAFSPDSPWQQELEAAFPYEETEDQVRAVEEVKRDMERPRPMDRLIVGDVGFGKTEIAVRAAFKAVMDGKQVAVLVPTTVLAQQHCTTFRQRLAPFPVNVAMLSRFLTRSQQQKVVEGLKNGSVDIVIGTHRLLSRDVAFKDLGLLIVDEEQRFGVAHKERLKRLRAHVDVLTLTATPIPRTLHMSLTGIRDLSTIDTPPEERLPIKTTVAEYDEHLVRQAILRELDRGGQVYWVHNRVVGIEVAAQKVQHIVPEARVAVAHGQMPGRELERTMLAFADGEIDVLVCTTIIENGLDIPRANTIIINHADRFGLAQLYQLRGRVGRGAIRAYAYLLYDKGRHLSPEARRRLEAIYEASELGAGFRVAMQDLELRGAGELLGARQHGHIAAIGFDLYARLLAKTIQELKERGEMDLPETSPSSSALQPQGDPLPPAVQMDLPLSAYLPESYVSDEPLRLQLYRRIAELNSPEAIETMKQELRDRFGPVPEPVEQLLYVVRMRMLARQAGVERIGRQEGMLVLYGKAIEAVDRLTLQNRLDDGVRVGKRSVYIPMDAHWPTRLERALEVLSRR